MLGRLSSVVSQRALARSFSSLIAPAQRVQGFGPSVFGEFTQLCNQHKAVNLGQGFPDFEAPDFVKKAAQEAIAKDFNQYTRSAGHPMLVNVLSDLYGPLMNRELNPLTDIVVTTGATEAGFASMQALLNPGDEVLLMEPFYDAYPAWVKLAGGVSKFVPLRAPAGSQDRPTSAQDWTLDFKEYEAAITPKTKALVLNTPHNPLGKIFSRAELEKIADIAKRHNLIVFSDEVYDFLTFDGAQHHRIASLPGMWERTVTLGSAGKTFSTTGWKVGWTIASKELSHAIFMAHQWIPFCVATPLQEATAHALKQAQSNGYFQQLQERFQSARDLLYAGLRDSGLNPIMPQGGYFIVADTSSLQSQVPLDSKSDLTKDNQVCRWLVENVGVGPIPPSAFYSPENRHLAENFARFAFCKRESTIQDACQRLRNLSGK